MIRAQAVVCLSQFGANWVPRPYSQYVQIHALFKTQVTTAVSDTQYKKGKSTVLNEDAIILGPASMPNN